MNWTKEAPTEEGYYYVIVGNKPNLAYYFKHYKFIGKAVGSNSDVKDVEYWGDKIKMPDMSEVSSKTNKTLAENFLCTLDLFEAQDKRGNIHWLLSMCKNVESGEVETIYFDNNGNITHICFGDDSEVYFDDSKNRWVDSDGEWE